MVICCELVALKMLDRCLIQLEHNDFMQKIEALDIFLTLNNLICQLCYPRNLGISTHEEGLDRVFAISHFLELLLIVVSPSHLFTSLIVHRILLLDRLKYSL